MDSAKRKYQRGLVLLLGILVGVFLFFGGFNFNKDLSKKDTYRVKTGFKSVPAPIFKDFFS